MFSDKSDGADWGMAGQYGHGRGNLAFCFHLLLGLLVGTLLVLAGAWFADRALFWQLVQMYADLFEMMRRILPRYD